MFLSQSLYTPVVRSLDLLDDVPRRGIAGPLQILGVLSVPDAFPALDVEGERVILERALHGLTQAGTAEIRWLERATLSDLSAAIDDVSGNVHVLHYTGHGLFDESSGASCLVLEQPNGQPQVVTGEELSAVLRDARGLRLVVLNASEGSRTSRNNPFAGVASSLAESGIPAVIGMQFEVSDAAALTFADRLYSALAQGMPIDASVAQARKGIFAAGNELEWATPTLLLRGNETRII